MSTELSWVLLVCLLTACSTSNATTSDAAPADGSAGDTAASSDSMGADSDEVGTGDATGKGDSVGDSADSTSSDGGGETALSADTACAQWVAAECGRRQTCRGTTFKSELGDLGTCKSALQPMCLSMLSAPSTGATPENLADCATALDKLACHRYRAQDLPATCRVKGTVADGSGCAFDSQCASGFCQVGADTVNPWCGKCWTPPAASEACKVSEGCAPGLSCSVATFTCKPRVKLGDACVDGDTVCDSDGTCVSGTCVPYAKVGEACNTSSSTVADCDAEADLVCEMSTCKSKKIIKVGDMCELAPLVCLAGGCFATTPNCNANPKIGEPCGMVGVTPDCMPPGYCVSGTCVAAAPAVCK